MCQGHYNGRNNAETIYAVNYSPPFQAPHLIHELGLDGFSKLHRSLKAFSDILARPDLTYTIDLQPGDCVAFDNRRVLHARTAFTWEAGDGADDDGMPARWLKGMYVEGDSVRDLYRVLRDEDGKNEDMKEFYREKQELRRFRREIRRRESGIFERRIARNSERRR
jgi:hypothetical protein